MTGQQIIDLFKNIVDDETVDSTHQIDLLNTAKEEVESERDWEFLKKLNSSLSWGSGETYLSEHALPSDFLSVVNVYIEGHLHPWRPVPYEHRDRYKDLWGRYYIDYANKKLYLCGVTGQARTINIWYIYQTDDLTVSTSPVWDSKHHKLLAYKMAELYLGGTDSDKIADRMGQRNYRQYITLKRRMERLDDQQKLDAINHTTIRRPVDASLVPDVITELANR